jgi:hypothetical protein
MPTLRSIRWALVLVPALFAVTACESNENRIDTRGTTTSPEAVTSVEDSLKRGAEKPKKTTPSSYPGAARRK